MFEITPIPEFSAWFESLEEPLAEAVAGELDLIAAAIGALSPGRVSRALLWFDGLCGDAPVAGDYRLQQQIEPQGHVSEFFEDLRELMLWHREIVRLLESNAFRERLSELEAKAGTVALSALERVTALLRAARIQIGLETAAKAQGGFPSSARRVLQTLSPREEKVLSSRFGATSTERLVTAELSQAFRELLQLVGLDSGRIVNSESGLRELTVNTSPRLRVLFGLDAPARRLVLLLGEPLDRQYYGGSVQFAEQRWRDYCLQKQQETRETR